MKPFDYREPATVNETWSLLEQYGADACLLAGGTDLVVRMKKGVSAPRYLVNIKNLSGLQGIRREAGALHLGPAVRLADLAAAPEVCDAAPVLAEAVLTIGTPQVRNLGTIGGNLCNASPCADSAPALLVLDAEVEITGPGGVRTLPLHDFFTGPGATCLEQGELLTDIVVPLPEEESPQIYLKQGPRKSGDISVVGVAALLTLDGEGVCRKARIALGSVAPVPLRIREAEELLEGIRPDSAAVDRVERAVQAAVRPISDVRGSEAYRRDVAGTLTSRALSTLMGA
ncbi:MAG: xanthine dehydrogenase family protein subunit M [Synergistales bacterium]|nr:xanthine dehydrogenase family protein subunit M [Synergistales bacterium]